MRNKYKMTFKYNLCLVRIETILATNVSGVHSIPKMETKEQKNAESRHRTLNGSISLITFSLPLSLSACARSLRISCAKIISLRSTPDAVASCLLLLLLLLQLLLIYYFSPSFSTLFSLSLSLTPCTTTRRCSVNNLLTQQNREEQTPKKFST